MLDEIRRMALITSGVAELTRNRAEQIVRDLVKAGDVRRDQTSGLVKELLKRSSENRRELTRFVRAEIQNQIEALGLATKRDLERIERRVTRLESSSPKKTTSKKTTARKTTSKSTTAKKTTAKKTTTRGAQEGASVELQSTPPPAGPGSPSASKGV